MLKNFSLREGILTSVGRDQFGANRVISKTMGAFRLWWCVLSAFCVFSFVYVIQYNFVINIMNKPSMISKISNHVTLVDVDSKQGAAITVPTSGAQWSSPLITACGVSQGLKMCVGNRLNKIPTHQILKLGNLQCSLVSQALTITSGSYSY